MYAFKWKCLLQCCEGECGCGGGGRWCDTATRDVEERMGGERSSDGEDGI